MSELNEHISQLREDFMKGTLSEQDVNEQPYVTFEQWMQEAIKVKVLEVQACHVSTANKEGKPSGRIVYLREFGNDLFYFYSNYDSRKGHDIDENDHVCLTFFWPELERQIRIEGTVKRASEEKSNAYFNSRPTESKIGAWSSPQSKAIANRTELEQAVKQYTEQFKGAEVPRPIFWGGYVITADYYEFWQGRKSRLHDRICYSKQHNSWKIERLAP